MSKLRVSHSFEEVAGLVLLDLNFKNETRASRQLLRDFSRWQLDNDCWPYLKSYGPLGHAGAWSPEDAKKVKAWFKSQGVAV